MMKTTPPPATPKLGPGEYIPDIAFTRIEDLPKPKRLKQSRNYPVRACPQCGLAAPRHKVFTRHLHDLGDLVSGRPHELELTYSQHHCAACAKYFNADSSDLAPPQGHYTQRVMTVAVRLVVEDGLPYRAARRKAPFRVGNSGGIIACLSPSPPSRTGWRPGGKRASERWETDYLNWALTDFSGYLAADELYDGPFCVLSIVDNRTFKRLFYQVLEHDPDQVDIIAFFSRFQAQRAVRHLQVLGITTDGSPLYPEAIQAVFGGVPHQLRVFHLLKDLNYGVLRAVAQVRKQLAAQQPKLKRGRPTGAQRKVVQKRQRLQQKISDLFEHRYLFVQRQLSASERATLQQITRGLPHLRTLRALVDEIYQLFDRRCRTETALAKLARLRQRVQRFTLVQQVLKTLFSANVEKALTFLDDRLLGATSNAVERGNRRYRKMQKTVYRVRSYGQVVARVALDLFREAALHPGGTTLERLHAQRAGPSASQ